MVATRKAMMLRRAIPLVAVICSVVVGVLLVRDRSILDDMAGDVFPIGTYQGLLWSKTLVEVTIGADGRFDIFFQGDEDPLTGRLRPDGDSWRMHYQGQSALGDCFLEASRLVRVSADLLEGECRFDAVPEPGGPPQGVKLKALPLRRIR